MERFMLCLTVILIIILIFLFVNFYMKKQIDNFGIYCGRYNLDSNTAQSSCSADSNCQWKSYTDSSTGLVNNWCTDAPPAETNS